MALKLNYVKGLTGKDKQKVHIPTLRETMEEHLQELSSGRPLFTLGETLEGPVKITENDRESHFHIIGGIGQGKSKFLEYLIRHDIDRLHKSQDGCGLCFLDGSEDGATMRSVLSYCAQIGFEKVLLIDPLIHTKDEKRPCINPFSVHPDHWNKSVQYLVDAFRVVFEVEDVSRTPFIKSYLTSLFTIFHITGNPPSDLIYFTEPPDEMNSTLKLYEDKRNAILEMANQKISSPDFPGRWKESALNSLGSLRFAYKNASIFMKEVGSTARRLKLFANAELRAFFNHREGVSFYDLVSKGWVVLVNVDKDDLGEVEARLLGTVIINQLIQSVKVLRKRGFDKPYYLYIDEAGDYVTDKLADILAKKRKIGFRTVLAHQDLSQLTNPLVRQAIVNHTHTKCAFYIADQDERTKVFRMLGYGGDLKPEEAAWNMQSQKKQEMVIRLPKQLPKKITVPFVPDPKGEVEEFINRIFSHKWYKSNKDISEDVRDRFKGFPTQNTKSTQPPRASDRKADSKSTVPPGVHKRRSKDVPEGDEEPKNSGGRGPISV